MTTLNDLTTQIASHPQDAPLIFETAQGEIGAGFHVTEFKAASINSITCGGDLDAWTETRLQLLDGASGTHMSVSRFGKIAAHSVQKISDLADAPLLIEYAPDNNGLHQYVIGDITHDETGTRVHLTPDHAQCKAYSLPKAITETTAKTACC